MGSGASVAIKKYVEVEGQAAAETPAEGAAAEVDAHGYSVLGNPAAGSAAAAVQALKVDANRDSVLGSPAAGSAAAAVQVLKVDAPGDSVPGSPAAGSAAAAVHALKAEATTKAGADDFSGAPLGQPASWDISDVGRWLQHVGFRDLVPRFAAQDIDGEVLLSLSAEELQGPHLQLSLGISKKLQTRIAKLAIQDSTSASCSGIVAERGADVGWCQDVQRKITLVQHEGKKADFSPVGDASSASKVPFLPGGSPSSATSTSRVQELRPGTGQEDLLQVRGHADIIGSPAAGGPEEQTDRPVAAVGGKEASPGSEASVQESLNKESRVVKEPIAIHREEPIAVHGEIELSPEQANNFKEVEDNHELPQDSRGGCSLERIVCIGNPGAGKSTLLNSLIGTVEFESGFSPGSGLTKDCTRFETDKAMYVDTPGLADTRYRQQAANEIYKALKDNCKYKIILVITLEAGHVRPQDKVTMELVLEALEKASIDGNYGIIVNKVPVDKDDTGMRDRVTEDIFRGLPVRGKIFWLHEVGECEDADQEILALPGDFRKFVDDLPSIHIESDLVAEIAWNKFEQRQMQLEAEIKALNEKNQILQKDIRELQAKLGQQGQIVVEQERPKAKVTGPVLERRVDKFQEGTKVVVLDRIHVRAVLDKGIEQEKELSPGQQGTVVSCDDMSLRMKLADEQQVLRVDKSHVDKLCRLADVEVVKRNKTRELAYRGISLGTLLKFYGKLGTSVMCGSLDPETGLMSGGFDPDASTTGDVVKGAIIPESKASGLSYAEHAQGGPRLARRMVSHNWGNLFRDLIAAIVADALDLPMYEEVRERLAPGKLQELIDELEKADLLDIVYWVCAFSINQHRSICKQAWFGCPCDTIVHLNISPMYEMDKFDAMMEVLFDPVLDRRPAKHVVAVDGKGVLFTRAWVVAELVAALCMDCDFTQTYKALNEQSLEELREKKGSINIWECKASNPEDETLVKQRARDMIERRDDSEAFHAKLNERIFELLAETGNQAQAMKLPHILCIGNSGVGKTSLINSMLRNATFIDNAAPGELCEIEHKGVVYMESPGLSDTSTRKKAARTITAALKRGGRYTVVFVVTLESGRVRPQDTEMMQLVLKAAPIGQTYTVLINKVTQRAIRAFKDKNRRALDDVKRELFAGLGQDLVQTNWVVLVEKNTGEGAVRLPHRFPRDAPYLYISKGRVDHIDEVTPEDIAHRLKMRKDKLQEENLWLDAKLLDLKRPMEDHTESLRGLPLWEPSLGKVDRPAWLPIIGPGNRNVPPEKWGITIRQFCAFIMACFMGDGGKGGGSLSHNAEWDPQQKEKHARWVNLYDITDRFVKPWTRNSGSSVALLMNNKAPLQAQVMISHAWGENIIEAMVAILGKISAMGIPLDTAIWFDAFAQYQPGDEPSDCGPGVKEQLKMDPFKRVIDSRPRYGMLVIHTSRAELYGRLWCVYEVSEAISANVRSRAAASMNYLSEYHDRRINRQWPTQELCGVSTETATCFSDDDERMIRGKIQQTHGFQKLDVTIFDFRREALDEMLCTATRFAVWAAVVNGNDSGDWAVRALRDVVTTAGIWVGLHCLTKECAAVKDPEYEYRILNMARQCVAPFQWVSDLPSQCSGAAPPFLDLRKVLHDESFLASMLSEEERLVRCLASPEEFPLPVGILEMAAGGGEGLSERAFCLPGQVASAIVPCRAEFPKTHLYIGKGRVDHIDEVTPEDIAHRP